MLIPVVCRLSAYHQKLQKNVGVVYICDCFPECSGLSQSSHNRGKGKHLSLCEKGTERQEMHIYNKFNLRLSHIFHFKNPK